MLKISKTLFILACLAVVTFLALAFVSGVHSLPTR